MSQLGTGGANRQKKTHLLYDHELQETIRYIKPPLCLLPTQWVYHPHGSPRQRQAIRIPFAHPFPYYLLPNLTPQHSSTSVHTATCAYHPPSVHICVRMPSAGSLSVPQAIPYIQMNPCAPFVRARGFRTKERTLDAHLEALWTFATSQCISDELPQLRVSILVCM